MAYGYQRQSGSNYGGGNQGGGGYQRNYQGNQGGGYQKPAPVIQSPEEFINERLDVHTQFVEAIKARGLDPADYAFFLGGWVTSYVLDRAKKEGR